MLKGKNLKKVYAAVRKVYKDKVGRRFRFEKGEKGRIKDVFTYVREAVDSNKEKDFDFIFKWYFSYLKKQTDRWLSWGKASRSNYIGFLERPDDIYTFVATVVESLKKKKAEEKEIAGTQDKSAWEF